MDQSSDKKLAGRREPQMFSDYLRRKSAGECVILELIDCSFVFYSYAAKGSHHGPSWDDVLHLVETKNHDGHPKGAHLFGTAIESGIGNFQNRHSH